MIEDNIVVVGREAAMGELKLKLNGYRRFWNRVYIGATADPESRWLQHAPDGWHKMVLLYRAKTPNIARSMERELITYARGCGFIIPVENITSGGEGLTNKQQPNYLYVLVGERRKNSF